MAEDFVSGGRLITEMTFSRQASAQFQLPKTYRAGSCVVYLDMFKDTDEDTVRTRDVWKDAMSLNRECVGHSGEAAERLGGVTSVGRRRLLFVTIFGTGDPERGARRME